VIETAQEVIIDGVKFVRAVGTSSGWLFVKHPLLEKVMLEYLPGEVTDEFRTYMYKVSQPSPITILSGPSLNCQKTRSAELHRVTCATYMRTVRSPSLYSSIHLV
jgi:hypothetical protein